MLSWMAWTLPTALVFVGIFSAMAVLIMVEIKYPEYDLGFAIGELVETNRPRCVLIRRSYEFHAARR